jgi:hypothetical protein
MSGWWYVLAITVLASIGLVYLRVHGIGRGGGGDGGRGDAGMPAGYHEDAHRAQRDDGERVPGAPDEHGSPPR